MENEMKIEREKLLIEKAFIPSINFFMRKILRHRSSDRLLHQMSILCIRRFFSI